QKEGKGWGGRLTGTRTGREGFRRKEEPEDQVESVHSCNSDITKGMGFDRISRRILSLVLRHPLDLRGSINEQSK
ncbi:hypothetical protein AVEN_135831-1, partial [Araneus ventricosus]